jgi:hypothetical protein
VGFFRRNAAATGLFSFEEVEPKMDDKREEGEGPLSSEALKRDEWRGGETSLDPKDAPGHTLPESERNKAAQDGGGDQRPGLVSTTILPPD